VIFRRFSAFSFGMSRGMPGCRRSTRKSRPRRHQIVRPHSGPPCRARLFRRPGRGAAAPSRELQNGACPHHYGKLTARCVLPGRNRGPKVLGHSLPLLLQDKQGQGRAEAAAGGGDLGCRGARSRWDDAILARPCKFQNRVLRDRLRPNRCAARRARVPGVTNLGITKRRVPSTKLYYAPDPSSADRCSIRRQLGQMSPRISGQAGHCSEVRLDDEQLALGPSGWCEMKASRRHRAPGRRRHLDFRLRLTT